MSYDNNNTGVLFKNDEKSGEKDPDYKGNAQLAGVEYWLNAWINTSGQGKKYMKLSFKAKDGSARQPAAAQQQAAPAGIPDDDIPF